MGVLIGGSGNSNVNLSFDDSLTNLGAINNLTTNLNTLESSVAVSDSKRYSSFNINNQNANTEILIPIDTGKNLFVQDLILNYRINGNSDQNRYWNYNLFKITNSFTWIYLTGGNTQPNYFGSLNISLNLQDLASNNIAFYLLQLQKVSNAGQLNLSARLNYRVLN